MPAKTYVWLFPSALVTDAGKGCAPHEDPTLPDELWAGIGVIFFSGIQMVSCPCSSKESLLCSHTYLVWKNREGKTNEKKRSAKNRRAQWDEYDCNREHETLMHTRVHTDILPRLEQADSVRSQTQNRMWRPVPEKTKTIPANQAWLWITINSCCYLMHSAQHSTQPKDDCTTRKESTVQLWVLLLQDWFMNSHRETDGKRQ